MALVTSCRSNTDDRPVIAVSIEPQRQMLEQIIDTTAFRIVTVLQPGANPETFEPSMSTRAALNRAMAYFTVGNLPFETSLARSAPELNIVATDRGIEPLYGTHDHNHGDSHHHHGTECGHDHGHGQTGDPHVWSSVKNASVMTDNMLDALVALYPDSTDVYTKRAKAFTNALDFIDRRFAEVFQDAPTRAFMVWHPSLSYFARDYGLEQIPVGWESKEVSPAVLRGVIERAKEQGAEVLFFQREFDSRQAEVLTRQTGARTVTVDLLNYNWIDQLKTITDEIAR